MEVTNLFDEARFSSAQHVKTVIKEVISVSLSHQHPLKASSLGVPCQSRVPSSKCVLDDPSPSGRKSFHPITLG